MIHVGVGKMSFSNEDLSKNITTLFSQVMKDKPSDAKGNYVKSFFVSSTMGPAVKINVKGVEK